MSTKTEPTAVHWSESSWVKRNSGRLLGFKFEYDGLRWTARLKWFTHAGGDRPLALISLNVDGTQWAQRELRMMSGGECLPTKRCEDLDWEELDQLVMRETLKAGRTQALRDLVDV